MVTKPRARSTLLATGVTGLKVGDAVSTIPAFSQNQYGVYGDTATVPAFAVAKHPASLSWVEAAAIWMQYATAYGALVEVAKLEGGRDSADSGRFEQRRPRRDSDCQADRRYAGGAHAQQQEEQDATGARRGARDRDRGAGLSRTK